MAQQAKMKVHKRISVAVIPIVLAVIFPALALGVLAYDNQARGGEKKGPHPTINEIVVATFVKTMVTEAGKPDPVLSLYEWQNLDSSRLRRLEGETITSVGDWRNDLTNGDKRLTFAEWIQEGGFTADEPEIQMSLLHFYDPTRPATQRYLTDIPDLGRYYSMMQRRGVTTWKFWKWRPVTPRDDIPTVNPEIDARYWAIEGDREGRFFRNQYSWNRGLEYMRQAFASTEKDKDRLFAKAWRALGETMHLMGDMTLPAHVRNDAHPAYAPAGDLRPDPYEALTREGVVKAAFEAMPRDGNTGRLRLDDAVDGQLWSQIVSAADPASLFHVVASYTNANFFSADTVAGVNRRNEAITNLNGGPVYPSPVLAPGDYDEQFASYRKTVAGQNVLMVTEKFLETKNWVPWASGQSGSALGKDYGLDTNADCAKSQAAVLVPVAIAANRQLVDWYMPRVTVEIEAVDPQTLQLTGRVQHHPYGAYQTAMEFSSGPTTEFKLYVDGRPVVSKDLKASVDRGKITADLSKLEIIGKVKLELAVDIGGIFVRSQPFEAELGDLLKYLRKCNYMKIWYLGRGVVDINQASGKQTVPERILEIGTDIPFPTPIKWNGTGFSAAADPDAKWPTAIGGINTNRRGTISGSVSERGLTIAELTYTYDAGGEGAAEHEKLTVAGLPFTGQPDKTCSDLYMATGKIFLCYIAKGAEAAEYGGAVEWQYWGTDEQRRPYTATLVRPNWNQTTTLKVAFIESK